MPIELVKDELPAYSNALPFQIGPIVFGGASSHQRRQEDIGNKPLTLAEQHHYDGLAEMTNQTTEEYLTNVGDINSAAKGSGARYNAGKTPLELLPLRFVALSQTTAPPVQRNALLRLAGWQERAEGCSVLSVLTDLDPTQAGWVECAQVFDYGQKKYAAWNWAKGMAWSVPMACAARHLLAMMRGELNDPESGLPHRGHVFCNIVMLLTYERTYPEGDDRPAAGLLAALPAAKAGL